MSVIIGPKPKGGRGLPALIDSVDLAPIDSDPTLMDQDPAWTDSVDPALIDSDPAPSLQGREGALNE